MSTPPTPATVEPGQVWRDNDQRTKGSGEFVVLAVVDFDGDIATLADMPKDRRDKVQRRAERTADSLEYLPLGEHAIVERATTGRLSRILVTRLLNGTNTRRGYTYLGMSK